LGNKKMRVEIQYGALLPLRRFLLSPHAIVNTTS
jgi:hypothetical protein